MIDSLAPGGSVLITLRRDGGGCRDRLGDEQRDSDVESASMKGP
jgi:hypothetical protein